LHLQGFSRYRCARILGVNEIMGEPAERAQRRRQLILPAFLLVLAWMQWTAVETSHRIQVMPTRMVDFAQLLAPMLVSLGLLRGFFGAPMWLRDKQATEGANDELTIENRRIALGRGFVTTVLALLAMAIAGPFVELDRFAIVHVALFVLVASILLNFVWLEQRGAADDDAEAP
jgi:hypothetical protein